MFLKWLCSTVLCSTKLLPKSDGFDSAREEITESESFTKEFLFDEEYIGGTGKVEETANLEQARDDETR